MQGEPAIIAVWPSPGWWRPAPNAEFLASPTPPGANGPISRRVDANALGAVDAGWRAGYAFASSVAARRRAPIASLVEARHAREPATRPARHRAARRRAGAAGRARRASLARTRAPAAGPDDRGAGGRARAAAAGRRAGVRRGGAGGRRGGAGGGL